MRTSGLTLEFHFYWLPNERNLIRLNFLSLVRRLAWPIHAESRQLRNIVRDVHALPTTTKKKKYKQQHIIRCARNIDTPMHRRIKLFYFFVCSDLVLLAIFCLLLGSEQQQQQKMTTWIRTDEGASTSYKGRWTATN